MELTSQQNTALEYIKAFVQDKDKSVFILMGYAGTGKTTMIKALIPEIQKIGKKVKLMAPTGRAAKVLKEKTGY
jgi:ATP-dependent exoDNAse (exonuclease V) alpha subunit